MTAKDMQFLVEIRRGDEIVAREGRVLGVSVTDFGELAPGFGAFVWSVIHSAEFDEYDPAEQDRLDEFWEATEPLIGIYDKRPVDIVAARHAWEETRERLSRLPWFDYEVDIYDLIEDEPW